MTITFTPEARNIVRSWLERDPSRPHLRLSFAGGCGALGYRLTLATPGPHAGERVVAAGDFTLYVDYKSSVDLDGATIEAGDSPDDIVVVHPQGVVGGMC